MNNSGECTEIKIAPKYSLSEKTDTFVCSIVIDAEKNIIQEQPALVKALVFSLSEAISKQEISSKTMVTIWQ